MGEQRTDDVLQILEIGGPDNGCSDTFLGQNPGCRNLCHTYAFLLSNFLEAVKDLCSGPALPVSLDEPESMTHQCERRGRVCWNLTNLSHREEIACQADATEVLEREVTRGYYRPRTATCI